VNVTTDMVGQLSTSYSTVGTTPPEFTYLIVDVILLLFYLFS